ncbi:peroxin [Cordyceps fumosorosea ARSEF 2679]|uniref:Peroxin n=1 Tax=Cordyceps fumosorosea (strain ARSEF 2679) TaxID=1081104 RepID=A0A167QIY7_CORFA|nr:peroxin [Cordyceps fumosorosea ARSEF 2679]OAA57682.1 peroxin [Cordyceps fumosorosea ARSEF 2679]
MDPTGAAPAKAEKQDVETKAAEVPAASTHAAPAAAVADVPDPDEDDLDDLDDMLDDFSTVKLDAKKSADTPATPAAAPAAAAAPVTGAPAPETGAKVEGAVNPEDMTEEDFAKQLQAGMANLLGELEKSPEMQAEFESMFKGMAAGADGDAAPGSGAPAAEESFQDTIRRTMERMQTSGEQATAAAAEGGSDDFMSELLKQMAAGGGPGGEGGEEEFSKMLMGMMEQLTNKEILYEPMKELHDKFPAWLAANRDKTPAEDLKRYTDQHALVDEIVACFEASTYTDSNAADREYIVDRMQKMQELGSPPSDLVGDLDTAQEAFAGADEQCNPQ